MHPETGRNPVEVEAVFLPSHVDFDPPNDLFRNQNQILFLGNMPEKVLSIYSLFYC
jgi:hypothetical protein